MNKYISMGLGVVIGLGIAALGEGCCVRPETIEGTLRMQDAAATAELCNSLDLQNESARMREECRNAYRMLNTKRSGCEDECGSGYEPVWR